LAITLGSVAFAKFIKFIKFGIFLALAFLDTT